MHRYNESKSSPEVPTAVGRATATHDSVLLLISRRNDTGFAVHVIVGEFLAWKDVSQREEGDPRQPSVVRLDPYFYRYHIWVARMVGEARCITSHRSIDAEDCATHARMTIRNEYTVRKRDVGHFAIAAYMHLSAPRTIRANSEEHFG